MGTRVSVIAAPPPTVSAGAMGCQITASSPPMLSERPAIAPHELLAGRPRALEMPVSLDGPPWATCSAVDPPTPRSMSRKANPLRIGRRTQPDPALRVSQGIRSWSSVGLSLVGAVGCRGAPVAVPVWRGRRIPRDPPGHDARRGASTGTGAERLRIVGDPDGDGQPCSRTATSATSSSAPSGSIRPISSSQAASSGRSRTVTSSSASCCTPRSKPRSRRSTRPSV